MPDRRTPHPPYRIYLFGRALDRGATIIVLVACLVALVVLWTAERLLAGRPDALDAAVSVLCVAGLYGAVRVASRSRNRRGGGGGEVESSRTAPQEEGRGNQDEPHR